MQWLVNSWQHYQLAEPSTGSNWVHSPKLGKLMTIRSSPYSHLWPYLPIMPVLALSWMSQLIRQKGHVTGLL